MQNNEENPLIKRDEYNSAKASYEIDVEHPELSKNLKINMGKIALLQKEQKEIIDQIVSTAKLPQGWRKEFVACNSYSGKVKVNCFQYVKIPEDKRPPRVYGPLEKLTEHVDIKTLFNSGVLKPDEKRLLLNIDEVIKEASNKNENV